MLTRVFAVLCVASVALTQYIPTGDGTSFGVTDSSGNIAFQVGETGVSSVAALRAVSDDCAPGVLEHSPCRLDPHKPWANQTRCGICVNGRCGVMDGASKVDLEYHTLPSDPTSTSLGQSAIGLDGYPVFGSVVVDATTNGGRLMFTHCNDPLCQDQDVTWFDTSTSSAAAAPAFAVHAQKRFMSVLWADTSGDMIYQFCEENDASCVAASASAPVTLATQGTYVDDVFDVTIDHRGRPVFVWCRLSASNQHSLYAGACLDKQCSSFQEYILGPLPNSYHCSNTAVAINVAPDNTPLISISYQTSGGVRSGEVQVLHCGSEMCNDYINHGRIVAGTTSSILPSLNRVQNVATAYGSDGYLVMAALFAVSGVQNQVAVIHCGSSVCAKSSITLLNDRSLPTTALGPQITILPNGFPLVSLHSSDGSIYLVYCESFDCKKRTVQTYANGSNSASAFQLVYTHAPVILTANDDNTWSNLFPQCSVTVPW